VSNVDEQIRIAIGERRWLNYLALREFDNDAGEQARWAAAISLHNDGEINLLGALTEFDVAQDIRFFSVMRFYSHAIPELDASPEAMLAAVSRLVKEGGPNRDGGAFGPALRSWCGVGDRAPQIAALLDMTDERASWYLRHIMQGAALGDPDRAIDWAIRLIETGSVIERGAALDALSGLGTDDPSRAQRALTALMDAVGAVEDDDTLSRLLLAAVEIQGRSNGVGEAEVCAVIDRASRVGGIEMRFRAMMALWFHWKSASAPVLDRLVLIAKSLGPEDARALDHLDHALYQMLGSDRIELTIEIVTAVLAANHGTIGIRTFDSFCDHLLVNHTSRFEQLAVEWLISGERSLGEAVMSMVLHVHGEPIFFTVELAPFGYDAETLIFLARKAVGYLFSTPVTAASLLLTVMRTGVTDAVQAATELLADPLLVNYSGDTGNYLRDHCQRADDPATPHVAAALAQMEAYIDGLRAVGRVKAFDPSERERIIQWRLRQDEMQAAMKEGEKGSILAHIATKVILLHGNRSITYVDDPGGETRRLVNDMQSFSHFVEAARMITVDPLGLGLMLRQFRAERMR
jgi:hypothetical protein